MNSNKYEIKTYKMCKILKMFRAPEFCCQFFFFWPQMLEIHNAKYKGKTKTR